MAPLQVLGSLLCLSCIVLEAEANHYYMNIHQKKIGSTDAEDEDTLVLINVGASTATVTYTNYRSNGWFSGDFSFTALQSHTLSLETKMLISYSPNAEQLVMKFSSDTSSIKIISYNRVVTQTALDAFVPLPTDYVGQEYYVISVIPPGGAMQVSVMPVGSNAMVTYTMPPTNPVVLQDDNGPFGTQTNFVASEEFTTSVAFEEVHLFQSLDNLSGMKITSNQAIHVLVSSSVSIYGSNPDEDFTQNPMVPVKYWGKSHVVAIQNLYSDRILIVSASSSTTVNMAAETPTQYCYFLTTGAPGVFINFRASDSSYYISTSEPVAVAHLIVTPAQSFTMYMVTPVEQFVTTAYNLIPLAFQTFSNKITVYTNTTRTAFAILNGGAISGTWTEIPGSGFSYISTSVVTGTVFTVSTTSNDGVIGGFVHGYGAAESYSYPLSSDCRDILTGCGGSTCYETNTFDFSTCPPAPTTTVTPPTTPTNTLIPPTATAVTASTTTPATFRAAASSLFCSDIETRFYIGPEFLGSVSLNITDVYLPSCPCNCTPILDDADATIKLVQRLVELRANLTVDFHNTGAYIRTKTCAEDKRPSAAAMGSLCTIVLVSIMAFVILIDMRKLILDGRHCRRLVRDKYRTSCGDRPVPDEPPMADEEVFCLEKLPHVII